MIQRLTEGMDIPGEPIPGLPLIEISGDQRVLIENHRGIPQYTREEICVKMKYGWLSILGSSLELVCMSRERLIVGGKIDQVKLMRRE